MNLFEYYTSQLEFAKQAANQLSKLATSLLRISQLPSVMEYDERIKLVLSCRVEDGQEGSKHFGATTLTLRNGFAYLSTPFILLEALQEVLAIETEHEFSLNTINADTEVSLYCATEGTVNFSPFVTKTENQKMSDIQINQDWKQRELSRLLTGEYQPLPSEALNLLSYEEKSIVESHYPHLSKTRPGLIAYTQTPEKGALDIQTPIKPGKFLKAVLPSISNNTIKQWCCYFESTEGLTLHTSSKEVDFEWVYTNTYGSSCMAKPASEFSEAEGYHPVRSYAHPDNDIVILWVESPHGIIGRCLGNKETMQYTRIYATDPENLNKCFKVLTDHGWTQNNSCLKGQKLLKVHNSDGKIICPYIDTYGVEVEEDNLRIVEDGFHVSQHTGLLDIPFEGGWECACCVETFEELEEFEVSIDYETVCPTCSKEHYTKCFDLSEGGYRIVHNSEPRRILTYKGTTFTFNGEKLTDGMKVCDPTYKFYRLDYKDYYEANTVSFVDFVVCDDNNCVIESDMVEWGLFVGPDGDILEADDYIVLDGKLIEAPSQHPHGVIRVYSQDSLWQVPHYVTVY